MASFVGDSFRLVDLSFDEVQTNVACDAVPENIILTLGDKRSVVFNVKDHKVVCDWHLGAGGRLLTPVVAHTPQEDHTQYVAVLTTQPHNTQVIRSWDKDAINIAKAHKHGTPPKRVHKLLSAGSDVLVVYHDTTWSWLSTAGSLTQTQGQPDPHTKAVLWCEALTVKDTVFLVIVTEHQEASVRLTVHQTTKDAPHSQAHTQAATLTFTQGRPLCHCLTTPSTHDPALLTLCDDGTLYKTSLSNPSQESKPVSMVKDLGKHSISMATLDDTQLLIGGICSEGKEGVGIWDTAFSLLQSWRPFPSKNASQVYPHGNQALLCCGGGLYGYQYTLQPASLRANLGKYSSSGTKSSTTKFSSPQEFEDGCTELLKQLSPPGKQKRRGSSGGEPVCDETMLRPAVSDLLLYCVQRPLQSSDWPRERVRELISTGLVGPDVSAKLVQALCDRRDPQLLLSVLSHVPNLPETALVQILACFLGLKEEEASDIGDVAEDDSTTPHRNHCLTQVLLQPYNDVFLVEGLRTLDTPLVQELLEFLCNQLTSIAEADPSGSRPALKLAQVVEWVSLLLDAQFTRLVLSRDSHSLLLQLHNTVNTQMEFYEELVSLEGIVSLLRERCVVPPRQHIGHYCIQTLHIH